MKELLKTAGILAIFFASTFLIIKSLGLFTIDDIELWLEKASKIDTLYVSLIVISLLFIDLFIAIPTLTTTLLAGYFLGFVGGALSVFIGFMLSGVVGYALSRRYGSALLQKIYKNPKKLHEMRNIFSEYGTTMLLICRAIPILPEVSCCLSGANKMPFSKFILFYLLGTVPYLLIATYAGSVSSLDNPKPAIFAAIGLSLVLWLSWFFFIKKIDKKGKIDEA